jgi:osmotically-inducible protein OsmY
MHLSLSCETDTHLHDNVQRELEWDPECEAGDLAVIVSEGVITVTGFVHSFAAKLAAERAVKRVHGVRGVVNDIQVAPLTERTDTEIARGAVHALRAHTNVPDDVTVTAMNGFLTLDGTVRRTFQKVAAGMAVANLDGVRGVSNHVVVRPAASAGDVTAVIDAALHRCASVDAQQVQVSVDGPVVTLSGQVSSWHEKQEAERAASAAPGITRIENRLVVGQARELRDALRRSTCSAGCAKKSAV